MHIRSPESCARSLLYGSVWVVVQQHRLLSLLDTNQSTPHHRILQATLARSPLGLSSRVFWPQAEQRKDDMVPAEACPPHVKDLAESQYLGARSPTVQSFFPGLCLFVHATHITSAFDT